MREDCRICGETGSGLQTHRVVPREYGGSDSEQNLVVLCDRCKAAVESIYDESFYRRLGVDTEDHSVELRELDSVFDIEDGGLLYAEVYNHFFSVEIVDSGWRGERFELFPVPDQREGVDPPNPTTLYAQEDRVREIQQGDVYAVTGVEGDLLSALKGFIDQRRE